MLFNSLSFAVFFPIVFIIYWSLGKKGYKWQNIFLLAASYYFYAQWDWRFVFLLAFSTLLDYYSGIAIYNASSQLKKKTWLFISVGINLGFLGFFKYYNFFIHEFSELLQNLGFQPHFFTLNIILPVGISFYTFHGLSYVFDIYNKKFQPTKNIVDYSLFVSFFPLLVAGPIERARHLLPQIQSLRVFTYERASDGMKQVLWGLFKKMVIADNCAIYANQIFANYATASGSDLFLGAVFFTFQIYGDFSGYSDIALGTARILGFDLLKNFNFPYFSRDIAEFWRRWHISLSSWFKDYLYIPLGGSHGGNWMRIRNTFIIFIVSGFWHGANWTFIAWGTLNALFILPSIILRTNRNYLDVVAKGKIFPNLKELFQVVITFLLTVIAWVFFRSNTITDAVLYVSKLFDFSLFSAPTLNKAALGTLILVAFLLIVEWFGRENNYGIEKTFSNSPQLIRWSFYAFIIMLLGLFMATNETPFIYFQF